MKIDADELLEEIGEDFCNYLNRGFNPSSFAAKVDPSLNIDNLQRLLDLHFLISEDVRTFVKALPHRLRRVTTSTSREKETTRGEIRGRISWTDTVKHRYSTNPKNKSTYVCDRRERDYDTDENLVLKQFLQHLHRILTENEGLAETGSLKWFREWSSNGELHKILREAWMRNIHLRNIHLDDITVTQRMIRSAKNSRKALYREAGTLLKQYRQLQNYDIDPSYAHDLLEETFIQPQREEVLFELYWVVRLIRSHNNREEVHDLNFQLIDPGTDLIATWKDSDYEYRLYHDSTGRAFQFHETFEKEREIMSDSMDTLPDGFLYRTGKVMEQFEELTDRAQGTLWGGRPDILIEKYERESATDDPDEVVIGEVKYTDQDEYAFQGLRELLEYMAFLRKRAGSYFEEKQNVFETSTIKGCLFTAETNLQEMTEGHQNIQILEVTTGIRRKRL